MTEESIYNELYVRAKNGETFTNLIPLVLSRENILLAYRSIKNNTGSNTAGTDKLTITDIGKMTPEEVVAKVRYIVSGTKRGYRPKPIRRKDIPKPNGSTRPLGIPCIWDRLIQQCFKQVLEPICEAHFSKHSYGFRSNRSVEDAIQETYSKLQKSQLHYVIEFDIKGFFDNVNHVKLIRQMWTLGIRDRHLLGKILRILKAPIKLPNGKLVYPEKGTPQGGIISPLLANIVLNELDHWVESNWEENPITQKYIYKYKNNHIKRGHGYAIMRKTKLKEMYIVRYADDFRIFCRTKTVAERTKIAITQWLKERLKLEVSQEKTRVVNVKRRYSEFLGFKIKVHPKGSKHVVKSHISDKQLMMKRKALVEQVKRIARPKPENGQFGEIRKYNLMVTGIQNYYRIATHINLDANKLNRAVMTVITNRLKEINRKGRKLTPNERMRYGKSVMLRYLADEPIYPIGYVQFKIPMNRSGKNSTETVDKIKLKLLRQPLYDRSIEYADNRISLYSAQKGKCAVTGEKFISTEEIHCHHKIPKSQGGTHMLIHATNADQIQKYLQACKPNLKKLNVLRKQIGNKILSVD